MLSGILCNDSEGRLHPESMLTRGTACFRRAGSGDSPRHRRKHGTPHAEGAGGLFSQRRFGPAPALRR